VKPHENYAIGAGLTQRKEGKSRVWPGGQQVRTWVSLN
jgi:hypothetical protein